MEFWYGFLDLEIGLTLIAKGNILFKFASDGWDNHIIIG